MAIVDNGIDENGLDGCVWLIGGTSESALLAKALTESALPFVVTVTTASARELYADAVQVFVGPLSPSEMAEFVRKWRVRCIVDASHPFAAVVSRHAIALVKTMLPNSPQTAAENSAAEAMPARGLTYLRYERGTVATVSQTAAQNFENNVSYVDSLESLMETDILQHQRVLFTVGYRHLARFSPLRQTSVLFARVLPSVEAISGAIAAGFSSKELVALRPPISPAIEAALWQQWKITCVVAKASGVAGGEQTKRAIAAHLGVQLILIKRPQLIYPNQTDSVTSAVEFCSKALSLY